MSKKIFLQFLLKKIFRGHLNKTLYRFAKGITNLNVLEVHITDHCNLNCRSCDHFSPLSGPTFIDLQKLEKEYRSLKPFYKQYFQRIHLLGGEPLLHPNIEQIIILTRKYFPRLEIRLYTNGIRLLNMPNSFWKVCFDNSVCMYISKYPININRDEIYRKINKWRVNLIETTEISYFYHYALDSLGKQDYRDNYKKCEWGGVCLQLRDGKLFPCARIAYIEKVNKAFGVDFQYDKNDFIEINKLNRWNFLQFILSPKKFCCYCNWKARNLEEWGYSNKNRDEWF